MSTIPSLIEVGDVAIVLVNYHRVDDTLRAINSLKHSTYTSWRAIVIDNEATAESSQIFAQQLSDHIVFSSKENLGFATGCNKGIEIAREAGFDFVFLLNNDAVVEAGTLEALMNASISLGNSALLGSVVRLANSSEYQFVGARRDKFGEPLRLDASVVLYPMKLIETDYILGAALFSPLKILDQIGSFDERFFLNYEETDLCFRAKTLGIPEYVVPQSIVYHASSSTLGDADGALQSYFLWRNEFLFLEKNATVAERLRSYSRRSKQLVKIIISDICSRRGMSISTASKIIGVKDYLLRRFGDCPVKIRTFAEHYANGERYIRDVK